MKKTVVSFLCLIALFLVIWHATAQDQPGYVVIAHEDNPATSVEKAQLSKMLMKKVSRWDDGTRVEPVDQGPRQAVRAVFSKEVHGRSVSAIKSRWQSQIFSGKGVPPLEVASDREVIDFVKTHRGGVGYISRSTSADGVKELTVVE
ncbi:MAG: hypothetical protein AAF657_32855 [Acidobacteriota bacterium]